MIDDSIIEPCETERSVQVDYESFLQPWTLSSLSPIDDYLSYSKNLILLGTESALIESPALGRVLLLGLVSSVEFYFRSILANLITLCPQCFEESSKNMLSLGAVFYHGLDDIGYGLTENISFSSANEIKKHTEKITGISINSKSSVATSLAEFEKICQFRHASVHARGELNEQNVRLLGLQTRSKKTANIRLLQWHSCMEVSHNLIRSYNRYIYKKIIARWIEECFFTGTWRQDRTAFSKLFSLFYSTLDHKQPDNARAVYRKLQANIRRRLASD